MALIQPSWPGAADPSFMQPVALIGALSAALPIWFLVAHRGAFAKGPEVEREVGEVSGRRPPIKVEPRLARCKKPSRRNAYLL